jgi:glycosyltransferase involved in cell wall biosynthesis
MESISYIVCTHNPSILERCLLKSLLLQEDDEIVVVEKPHSIAQGYNTGIDQAKHKIKCFIHHDIIVTNPHLLRMNLLAYCVEAIGMIGIIGSQTEASPWWEGQCVGSVIDTRSGILFFSDGKQFCLHLDGLMLATCQDVRFDESIPGYHLYDQDICRQMADRGLKNFCIKDGYRMLTHFTQGMHDINQINGYTEALQIYRNKWIRENT